MDGRILRHFHHLPWMVCGVSWAPIIHIHTGIDIIVNLWMSACVRLIHHCTSNQARGSNTYWMYNTQMMGHHGWMNNGTPLASTLYGVWCTMNSSHCCMCWHPSHLIHRCMGDVGSSLLKQPSKRITFILDRQHLKDLPWVDGRKLQHFHPLP